MGLKGTIQPDHIPVNKYQFAIVGLIPILFTKVSGLEEVLDEVQLPDRTMASGGNTQPIEFTVTQPAHHTGEVAAMEVWYQEGKDPQTPTYKKPVTLSLLSGTGATVRSYTLVGVWVKKRKTPDLDMDNPGDMAAIEWTLSCDSMLPI